MKDMGTGDFVYLCALYVGFIASIALRDGWGMAAFSTLLVIKQLGRIRTTIERSQR